MLRRTLAAFGAALLAATACSAGGGSGGDRLVIYSGRAENLIKPLLDMFEKTGTKIEVRYGGSAELAAQILEEGDHRKADVFLSQDAGALGALAKEGVLEQIPTSELLKVEPRFHAKNGTWIGVSGRVRAVVYNPELIRERDLPRSVFSFADPKWEGKVGIAPTNASFQAFVTAMRITAGEARTREWLVAMKKNAKIYENNIQIRDAVDAGQIPVGLVNHYYLYEKIAEIGLSAVNARNHYFAGGDVGALINVSGVGIIKGTKRRAAAEAFVTYMLSQEAQRYYAEATKEYPLIDGVSAVEGLPPLSEIEAPLVDLSDLASLKETLDLLADVGLT